MSQGNTTNTTTFRNDEDNTSKTTKASNDTTDTTTEKVEVQDRPTGDQASKNYPGGEASPAAERQGEVVADKGAETNYVGADNGTAEDDARVGAENVENAKQDALRNANDLQKNQPTRDSSSSSDRNSKNRGTDRG